MAGAAPSLWPNPILTLTPTLTPTLTLTRCGSAALGGYLADRFGYTFTFLVTASIQGTATLLQATLVFVVPRSEQPASAASVARAAAVVAAEAEPDGPAVAATGSVQ